MPTKLDQPGAHQQYPGAGWCGRVHPSPPNKPLFTVFGSTTSPITTPTRHITARAPAPASSSRLTAGRRARDPLAMPEAAARAGYVPLGAAERKRRALFLQSYRFSVDDDGRPQGEALRGRLLRRLREAGAGLARAWRGWRPRAADHPLLACFVVGVGHHHHRKYYVHGYA